MTSIVTITITITITITYYYYYYYCLSAPYSSVGCPGTEEATVRFFIGTWHHMRRFLTNPRFLRAGPSISTLDLDSSYASNSPSISSSRPLHGPIRGKSESKSETRSEGKSECPRDTTLYRVEAVEQL